MHSEKYLYRKSKVCGKCWLNKDRRKYPILHISKRKGRCDFCGRHTDVWVTIEPTSRSTLEILLYFFKRPFRKDYPLSVWSSPATDYNHFWDLRYEPSEEEKDAADERCAMLKVNKRAALLRQSKHLCPLPAKRPS